MAAIILFPAAASPPFLNWEYSAAFSSAGSAISDRYEASRSHNLGNTQQGAGDIVEETEKDGQKGVTAALY